MQKGLLLVHTAELACLGSSNAVCWPVTRPVFFSCRPQHVPFTTITHTCPHISDMCCCQQDVGEEPYKANVMKITGNFFIVACVETIAEAMTLAEKNGIPRQAQQRTCC